jgi:hypothetical protein
MDLNPRVEYVTAEHPKAQSLNTVALIPRRLPFKNFFRHRRIVEPFCVNFSVYKHIGDKVDLVASFIPYLISLFSLYG